MAEEDKRENQREYKSMLCFPVSLSLSGMYHNKTKINKCHEKKIIRQARVFT